VTAPTALVHRDSERRESTAAVSQGKRVADTVGEGLAQSSRAAISTSAEGLEPRRAAFWLNGTDMAELDRLIQRLDESLAVRARKTAWLVIALRR
jgi:hypothetical protein